MWRVGLLPEGPRRRVCCCDRLSGPRWVSLSVQTGGGGGRLSSSQLRLQAPGPQSRPRSDSENTLYTQLGRGRGQTWGRVFIPHQHVTLGTSPQPLHNTIGVGREGFVVAAGGTAWPGTHTSITSPGRIPGTPHVPSVPSVPVRRAHIWCFLARVLFQELESLCCF